MSKEVLEVEAKSVEQKSETMELTNSKSFSWSVDDRGEIEAKNISEISSALQAYRKAELIPSQFKTNEVAMGAYLYCKNLGVDPLTNWGQVAHIHGKFAPFGSLFSALAQRDPDFGYDEVVYFDEEMNIISLENKNIKSPAWGCRMRSQKKGSPFIIETIFTMDDAKKANLIKNVWNTYPKDMLRWKCVARNYRILYPSALNGVMLADDLMKSWDEEKPIKDLNDL